MYMCSVLCVVTNAVIQHCTAGMHLIAQEGFSATCECLCASEV